MARPRLAQTARNDVGAIRDYSRDNFGAAVALDYVNGLRGAFKFLGGHPYAGAVETGLGYDIRGFSYRSHRIYYRVEGATLLIVRVLHHAQDTPATLDQSQ